MTEPKRPLRLQGSYENIGWDIPTQFCVDSDGCCWMNMAHGDPVHRTQCIVLIEDAEKQGNEEIANMIRIAIGQRAEEPLWARMARQHGWTPP